MKSVKNLILTFLNCEIPIEVHNSFSFALFFKRLLTQTAVAEIRHGPLQTTCIFGKELGKDRLIKFPVLAGDKV